MQTKLLIIISIIQLISSQLLFSQEIGYKYYNQSYICVPRIDSFYDIGDYRKSIEYNLMQIDSTGKSTSYANYVLAQDYSLLEMEDSALYYLNLYIDKAKDYRSVFIDEDFEILRKNKKKWNSIITKIEDIYLLELDSSMNTDLALKLFRIGIEEERVGFTQVSCRRKALPTINDKIKQSLKSQKEIKRIIKKYGLPTPSMVGRTAAGIAWDIIQHSRIEDKYYYLIKNAYENKDYSPELYALTTDRWLVQNAKKQIYGSQFSITRDSEGRISKSVLDPVEDFKNLNQRRSDLGLTSIEEYAKKMNGIIPEEYYNENN